MSCAHPRELFQLLNSIGASPKKKLSQNFLIDANILRKIALAAAIKENETILEIGPGPGALTEQLLKFGAQVIAIEKDPLFAKSLSRLNNGRLQIIEGDFLDIDLDFLKAPLKIVANLPYHIATPILEKLCNRHSLFSSAFLMVQKEMADRIVAKPKTKEMGALTIFIRTFATPSIAIKVSRNSFYPAPQVDSCVVKLDFHEPVFQKRLPLVRKAFQQRRKMLRSTLKIQLDPFASMRPEELSLENWVQLFEKLENPILQDKKE
jgi:16S rRNA (adenine1518-N6/adenine1519-N6)-dimethyltransferase